MYEYIHPLDIRCRYVCTYIRCTTALRLGSGTRALHSLASSSPFALVPASKPDHRLETRMRGSLACFPRFLPRTSLVLQGTTALKASSGLTLDPPRSQPRYACTNTVCTYEVHSCTCMSTCPWMPRSIRREFMLQYARLETQSTYPIVNSSAPQPIEIPVRTYHYSCRHAITESTAVALTPPSLTKAKEGQATFPHALYVCVRRYSTRRY